MEKWSKQRDWKRYWKLEKNTKGTDETKKRKLQQWSGDQQCKVFCVIK